MSCTSRRTRHSGHWIGGRRFFLFVLFFLPLPRRLHCRSSRDFIPRWRSLCAAGRGDSRQCGPEKILPVPERERGPAGATYWPAALLILEGKISVLQYTTVCGPFLRIKRGGPNWFLFVLLLVYIQGEGSPIAAGWLCVVCSCLCAIILVLRKAQCSWYVKNGVVLWLWHIAMAHCYGYSLIHRDVVVAV